ncbi:alpha/beta hydrolase [Bosea sp. TND4EK4]|uniref:alpha/beta hydrolase n=1 Tax=Bosea sp. TND4EK4 TaxID=1907408 RepID=UPI0009539BD7|nr:alpha/beta hydrolase [Bosea sp. TND4EK4]SIR08754.1 acetyl esterase [Bosea sp. TND4EK4]
MTLHPFIAAMLEQLKGRPALSAGTPQQARAMVAASRPVLGEGPELANVRDLTVPTRGCAIKARLFRPGPSPAGLIVYLHGGGWMIGTLDDYDALARTLAAKSGCAVLLPDYRLAPEHPFPAGLEDVEDVLVHLAKAGEALLGATLPLVIAGDSAGGNLATVAALNLRGQVTLAAQILIYPVTDSDFERRSYVEYGTGLPLTRQDMVWFFRHYASESEWGSPQIAPLRADELGGLPPTLIALAECDVLADEGRAYADALERAGTRVTRRQAAGVTHGFIRLHNLLDVAREEMKAAAEFAQAACRDAAAPAQRTSA